MLLDWKRKLYKQVVVDGEMKGRIEGTKRRNGGNEDRKSNGGVG